MLHVYFDDCKKELPKEFESYVSQYFDEVYEPEWFSDEFVKKIIHKIDKSEVIGTGRSVNIYNEFLGNLPPQNLSSGCKGLILLYKEDIKINGDRLGDNCMVLLLEIADVKDVTISLSHTPPFPDNFNAHIINSGKLVNTRKQFNEAWLDVRYGGA